jgi:hypothetical protein
MSRSRRKVVQSLREMPCAKSGSPIGAALSLAEFVCLLLWRGINESYALGHRGATRTPGPTEGPEYRPPKAIEGG